LIEGDECFPRDELLARKAIKKVFRIKQKRADVIKKNSPENKK
jgi:hypothetical protein